MVVNFFNLGGAYYSSGNSFSNANNHYYAGNNRKWAMYITADQMNMIKGDVKSAKVRVYNQTAYNSTFAFCASASLYTNVNTALTAGNYFGITEIQYIVLNPAWREFQLDVTSCFQYAKANWPGQAWVLWFYWSGGSSGTPMIGYNNTSYAYYRCPYFTIECGVDSYVYREEPKYCSYPQGGMKANVSRLCEASASSIYSSQYPAWRAFDKGMETNSWVSAHADTAPWIQLKLPKPLYNIQVSLSNGWGAEGIVNGPEAGIVYGSNDTGTTLTEIGTFENRDGTAPGRTTTIQCNNEAAAYDTVRISIQQWAKAGSNTEAAIGQISISGVDSIEEGGWSPATVYVYRDGEWIVPEAFMR